MTDQVHAIIADAIGTSEVVDTNDLTKRIVAARVLDTLRERGYVVVKLAEETKPYRLDEDGDVWDDDTNTVCSPMEAEILASRLLACAVESRDRVG